MSMLGTNVLRKEDPSLLRVGGGYVDEVLAQVDYPALRAEQARRREDPATPLLETPSPLNPLGAKGIGDSGTIGSTPAVQNAVVDALAHLGIRHVDIPTTSERVWRAITAAS